MFEAYKIGVTLTLVNNVSAALGVIGQHFAKAQTQVKEYQKQLDKINLSMLKGGAAMATGAFGFHLLSKTLAPAKEYAHQLSQLNVLGMKHAEIMGVVNKAWDVSRSVPTSNAADNIKAYRELRSAFGAGHEHEALGVLAKTQMVSGILASVKGAKQDGVGFDLVKAIELTVRGALSQEVLGRRMEMMTQAIVGMGGTVDAKDFHMALKYAKSGASSYSEDFLFKYLPSLVQEFKTGKHGGASSAGTALNAGYRMIVGQQIAKETFQNWIDAGLIDKSRVVANKHHTGVAKLLPGAVAGASVYSDNPEIWAQQYGMPAVLKLMKLNQLNQDQAIAALTKDGNKAFLLNTLINKAAQFQRDKTMIGQADSFGAYDKLLKTDPQLAEQALHKQWSNLLGIIGYQVMPELLKGTMWLIDTLKSLSAWVKDNEVKAKILVGAFTALSGTLLFGGAVTLLTASFKGLSLVMKGGELSGGIATLGKALLFPGVGAAGGAAGIISIAASLGALAGGLVLLGGATAGLAWFLNWISPNEVDKKTGRMHAGRSSFTVPGWTGPGSLDVVPESHAGEHFVRAGRGGTWIKNGPNTIATKKAGSDVPEWMSAFFGGTTHVHTHVHLDGREIAENVTKHQGRMVSKPQSGASGIDPGMIPLHP